MLSCSVWFSAPSLWMGSGLESRASRTAPSALHTRITQRLSKPPPIQQLGKPYAATHHLMLL